MDECATQMELNLTARMCLNFLNSRIISHWNQFRLQQAIILISDLVRLWMAIHRCTAQLCVIISLSIQPVWGFCHAHAYRMIRKTVADMHGREIGNQVYLILHRLITASRLHGSSAISSLEKADESGYLRTCKHTAHLIDDIVIRGPVPCVAPPKQKSTPSSCITDQSRPVTQN